MIDAREVKSYARSFLDSQSFEYLFALCFRPVVKRWLHRLILDETLDPSERKGIISAMHELHAGFSRAYEECELDIPDWLDEDFYRGPLPE